MFIRDHLDLKNIGRVNLESHTLNLSTIREATAEPSEQPLHALAVCSLASRFLLLKQQCRILLLDHAAHLPLLLLLFSIMRLTYGARGWTRPSPRCMMTMDWCSGRRSYNQRAIRLGNKLYSRLGNPFSPGFSTGSTNLGRTTSMTRHLQFIPSKLSAQTPL